MTLITADAATTALQRYPLIRTLRASCALLRTEALRVAKHVSLDLRSLDASHILTVLSLEDELGGVVTYDTRMISAAQEHGSIVASPA